MMNLDWRIILGLGVAVAIAASLYLLYERGYRDGVRVTNLAWTESARLLEQKQRIAIAQMDLIHTREMENARKENEKLAADVATGARRLSIRATCIPTAATATGVGDGETRAHLSPEDASTILRIARDGDDAIRQLTGCQAYIRAIRK